MRYQKRICFFFLLFLAALYCLPADHADGARIAGDSKVTPSAPESDSSDPGAEISAPEMIAGTGGSEASTAAAADAAQGEASGSEKENVLKTSAADSAGNAAARASGASKSAKAKGGEYIYIDFKDADILEFIKYISELTGRNFLIDSSVKGKVTIVSPTKITVEEAYKVFESVLEVNGITLVPSGPVTKVVPMTEARTKDIDTKIGKDQADSEDKILTQLIPLKYANPEDIQKALSPFISKNSVMTPYAPTGMLIVTDVLSNINRLLEIIEKIDVEGTSEVISVIPLKYAGAETMAKNLTSVFKSSSTKTGKETTSSAVIISDARTNSIITSASEIDTLQIKKLINLLDTETPRGEGEMHVYYLQNANAEDLAKVLTSLPTGSATASSASASAAKEGVKEAAVVLSRDIQILADKATNSLIINAGKDDFLVLEEIIKKLDIVRKMVYIEALIMEVSMTKEFELGVQWYGGETTGSVDGKDVVTFGSSNSGTNILPSIDTNTGAVTFSSGMSLGVLGDTITIGDLTFPSIAAVVRAYSANTDVNIISKPQVMTMDNEEASINVSQNKPYLTSKQETTTGNDYSNYDYKDVGVTLTITPQINQERFVKLKIEQTVSQVLSETTVGLPTTLKREAKTTVMIKDGQTVVIGGLIDETNNNAVYKVPILGSIPILGYLFRSKSQSTDKKNLYIFITPHIIENPAEANEVYENKIGQIDKIKEGVVELNKGRVSQTRDERLCDLGFSYLEVKEYDKAAEYYEKALTINPDNPVALLNMGIIYEGKNEFVKAGEMYEKVIALEVEDRTYNTINPGQTGKKVTDIAKENLENMRSE